MQSHSVRQGLETRVAVENIEIRLGLQGHDGGAPVLETAFQQSDGFFFLRYLRVATGSFHECPAFLEVLGVLAKNTLKTLLPKLLIESR